MEKNQEKKNDNKPKKSNGKEQNQNAELDNQNIVDTELDVEEGAVFSKKGLDQQNAGGTATNEMLSKISFKDIKLAMEVLNLQSKTMGVKSPDEQMHKQFQFWSTQPVPKIDEVNISECGPIIEQDINSIRKEEYSLPAGFKWDTMHLNDPLQLQELYVLLSENYVEDEDSMFRFDYQPSFLKWALQPPGWKTEWHCGVRVEKSGKLVGFISAIPITMKIYKDLKQIVEINFLCVHKKLRSKRLAPVLIREITRRVNTFGIFQAVYTAGVILPKPIGTCRYWHRSLNPKKLIEVKFSHLSKNMTLQRTIKFYKLPETPKTLGFRKMTEKDLKQVHSLLTKYLDQFFLAPMFSFEEFKHWFLPQEGVIDSFVVTSIKNPSTAASNANETTKSKKTGKSSKIKEQEVYEEEITDFISYYTLPSTIMHHPTHKSLKAAYSFYNVSNKTPWIDLMNDALISARNLNCDVFNALDLMDNKEFLKPCKFGIGDGNLQYYLYNWRCPSMLPQQIGLVLQ